MGLELELLPSHHRLPPIRTSAPTTPPPRSGGGDNDDNDAAAEVDGGCATPKSPTSVLRAPSTCPPAPRKPRPAKRKQLPTTHRRACCCSTTGSASAPRHAPVRWFIAVPHDVLAAVFVARPATTAPCPTTTTTSPATKKIRVHVVG